MKAFHGLISLAVLFGAAASANAVVLFDTLDGGFQFLASGGNQRLGDNVNFASAGAGMHWRIDEIAANMVTPAGAGHYSNISLTINVYNTVSQSGVGTDAAFGSLAGSRTISLPDIDMTTFVVFPMLASGLNIDLAPTATNSAGYGFEFLISNSGPGPISMMWGDITPTMLPGSTDSNGLYADTNNNGLTENRDFFKLVPSWQHGNLDMKISATAVPEPATIFALGAGLAFITKRRRKKA